MKFHHVSGSPLTIDADLLVLCLLGKPERDSTFKAIDRKLDGLLKQIAKEEQFTGKSNQRLLVDTRGRIKATRILILSGGDKKRFKLPQLRNLGANAVHVGNAKSAKRICFVLPPISSKELAQSVQLSAEGCLLGLYKFDKYLSKSAKKKSSVTDVSVLTTTGKGSAEQDRLARSAFSRARAVASATCQARDYVNEPAIYMTPNRLATIARGLARKHARLQVKVFSAKECEKLGMGMFLAVGRGSAEEPRLIHLTYTPTKKPRRRIALIGKGVTFDSGGYSLKPSSSMEDMKTDMAGAATVISAMGAIAELGGPDEVHGVTACCENLVSGRAYKLGDVLTAMDGTTVEINNTDAEGRLTLGDALVYTRTKIKPDEMFDFATLTGACVVALGPLTAGVLSPDDKLIKRWLSAAETAGEEMWRLPLNERLRDQLKSPIATMKNTGERWGGAITAGLFLKHFAKDTPWVHVDIAGPASTNSNRGAIARGGTGFAVATILEYLSK